MRIGNSPSLRDRFDPKELLLSTYKEETPNQATKSHKKKKKTRDEGKKIESRQMKSVRER